MIEVLIFAGKAILITIGISAGLFILLCAYVFHLMCTSKDNCTACPGALNGSCARCRIHKNKKKKEEK